MTKKICLIVRIIVLALGLSLAAYMIWQLFSGARMLDFDINTRGPLIVVVFSILLLLTIGAAVSYVSNLHYSSTIFLGSLLAIMSGILWVRHPEQADIYRLHFIYGLVVAVSGPFVLEKKK